MYYFFDAAGRLAVDDDQTHPSNVFGTASEPRLGFCLTQP
jgi:hypothetical protein